MKSTVKIALRFLQTFGDLTDMERNELANKLNVQVFKKKSVLQEEGKIPANCFYVLEGCVRQYYLVDGVEKTIEFYTSQNAAISSDSYLNKTPSAFYLQCAEDSVLLVGEPEHDARLISEFPRLPEIIARVAGQEWLKAQNRLSLFKLLSPEERYADFLKHRADLVNKVPGNQIASYLGVTPESLSRIRKRLLLKKK